MSSSDTLKSVYNTESLDYNTNVKYKLFPEDEYIPKYYQTSANMSWPIALDKWNETITTKFFITDSKGNEYPIEVLKPGTRPTFRSQYTVTGYGSVKKSSGAIALGCLTYRVVMASKAEDIKLKREQDKIIVQNGMFGNSRNVNTYREITKDLKNHADSDEGNTRPVFQDGVLPTRLLILLQGTGGGGSGGNKGWDNGGGGSGGGSGGFWFGVVNFEVGDEITIHIAKGGNGGALETSGSAGNESWIEHSRATTTDKKIVKAFGGSGGTWQGSGGAGGSIWTLASAAESLYWEILSSAGVSGGSAGLTGSMLIGGKNTAEKYSNVVLKCSTATSYRTSWHFEGAGYGARAVSTELEHGINYISLGKNAGGTGHKGGGGGSSLINTGAAGGQGTGGLRNGSDGERGAGGGGGGDKATFGGGSGTKQGLGGKGGDGAVFIWG